MKLLYKNKQIKRSNDSIVKRLMPSLIGIGVCVTSLLGTTFAWFSDTVSIATQSIESAYYSVNIQIKDGNTIVLPNNNGIYTLSKKGKGQGYKVSIISTGTASTGFCTINDNLITEQINQGQTFNFTLYPDKDNKEYTFTSIWGTPSEYSKISKIKNDDIVGTPLSENYVDEVNDNINNNLSIPSVESTNSQPEEVETIKPSEEPKVEEDNEIAESDSSDTEIDNSDIILDTTKEHSE